MFCFHDFSFFLRSGKKSVLLYFSSFCFFLFDSTLLSPSLSLSRSLSVCLSLCLSLSFSLTISLSLSLFFSLSVSTLSLSLSLSLSFFLSLFFSLSLSLSLLEPSREVAEYLKAANINKVIVGHQPRGDCPLIIDLGTGIQVRKLRSDDISYCSNNNNISQLLHYF